MRTEISLVNFQLAKIVYNRFHRTNVAPVGHRESYIMIQETGNYEPVAHVDYDDEDFIKWFNEYYSQNKEGDDFIWQADENGDPLLSSLGKIIGVLSIGNPIARFKDKNIFEITRICFHDKFNPLKDGFELPSQFVKESIRQFKIGRKINKIITYIHQYQKGKYLEYAGFKKDKVIKYSKNSKGWSNRLNRRKSDLGNKIRFVKELKDSRLCWH